MQVRVLPGSLCAATPWHLLAEPLAQPIRSHHETPFRCKRRLGQATLSRNVCEQTWAGPARPMRFVKPSAPLEQTGATCKSDPPRTRTWNLRLRRPTPYPLGQRANCPHVRFSCEAATAKLPMNTAHPTAPQILQRGLEQQFNNTKPDAKTLRKKRAMRIRNRNPQRNKLPAVGIEPTFPPKCFQ